MINPETISSGAIAADSLAKAIFGPAARIVAEGGESVAQAAQLTDNLVIKVGMLVLFVAYLVVVTLYWGQFGDMLKIILGRNIGIKVADELSYLFVKAMRSEAVVGLLTWALLAVGAAQFWGITMGDHLAPQWYLPLCLAVIAGLVLFGWLLTRGLCWLVRRSDLGEGLEILAEATLALSAVVATPIALLFVIGGGVYGKALLIMAIVVAAIGLLTYAIKSFVFFLEQKISILLWLLYLCAAVLIPLGVIVSTVLHNSTL